MTKKVLFLGASPQQIAPIKYAIKAGYQVITCDNVPSNPGHDLADKTYNVSTTDFASVLNVACAENIDAVVCYATDIAATTAAFVSEKLGLAGNPVDSVRILTNKGLFRQFQSEKGYFAPKSITLNHSDLMNEQVLLSKVTGRFGLPLIVKPVDSAGCKGITHVSDTRDLAESVRYALGHSLSGAAIAEQMIERTGYQICGEGFLQEGRIIFHAFANEHFAPGIIVPIGESFPSMFDEASVEGAVEILQSMMSDLDMRVGPFNFDLFLTPEGEVFVVEIGPRNGGNRMPEAILWANGADMISATVEAALGKRVELSKRVNRYFSTYSIHSKNDGVLKSIEISDRINSKIVDKAVFVEIGEKVAGFSMGSYMIGNLILSFDDYEDMLLSLDNMDEDIRVLLNSPGVIQ